MKKKLLSLALVLAMTTTLFACGSAAEEAAPAEAPAAEAPAASAEAAPAEAPAAAGQTYKVGICQLIEHPALDAATQGFQDALVAALGDAVEFDPQVAQGESAQCATIVNTFVSNEYDLIMANATAALQSAVAATSEIPVLGTSITDYASALDLGTIENGIIGGNVSGTSDLAPLDGQADVIKELFPEAKKVALLYCSAEANSQFQVDTIKGYLEALGYETEYYSFSDSNDIQAVCTKACSEVDVIYIPTDNTAANNTALIDAVCAPAGIPVIAGEEGIAAGCGVATLSISYYDLGYATGEMAAKILTGEASISETPIAYAPQFTKEYVASRAEALGVTIPADYVAIEE